MENSNSQDQIGVAHQPKLYVKGVYWIQDAFYD